MITEYDKRQIERMTCQLERFDKNELGLSGLIGDLEFLLAAVESIPDEWKKKVNKEIGVLEEVYAVYLDRGDDTLDEHSQKLVDKSVQSLKYNISEVLG